MIFGRRIGPRQPNVIARAWSAMVAAASLKEWTRLGAWIAVTVTKPMRDVCGGSGGNSVLDRGKAAETYPATIDIDLSVPFLSALSPENASHAANIVHGKRPVARVLRARNATKVSKAVIVSNAVDVINLLGWPFSGLHQPDYTMSLVNSREDTAVPVAATINGSKGFRPSKTRVPHFPVPVSRKHLARPLLPKQFPRLRFILEKLARNVVGKVSHIRSHHDQCGQGGRRARTLRSPAFISHSRNPVQAIRLGVSA